MLNGEVLNSVECDMLCAGTLTGEYCGGRDKITAYEIDQPVISEYIGCYADSPVRAMNAEGKYVTDDMTNEVTLEWKYFTLSRISCFFCGVSASKKLAL